MTLVLGTAASAHPLAPALLELREAADGTADVRWKTSRLRPRGVRLEPVLPAECQALSAPTASEDTQSVSISWRVDCGSAGLVGKRVAVTGLETARIDVLLRVTLADGRQVRVILNGAESALTIPERQPKSAVLASYLELGAMHILTGPDHLLFVFGLLLLTPSTRPLLKTLTAFTLGHSVTLSLAALGITNVPSGIVELLIAISVLMLAVELASAHARKRPSLLRRQPWLMAGLFGLLHGMGFAGALTEIGLPGGEIPLALFSFNVGIELGQLAFVAVILALRTALRGSLDRAPAWAARVPAYGIGIAAAYWCFERVGQL
jgi:hydrogenase/urease accessory protein HupE